LIKTKLFLVITVLMTVMFSTFVYAYQFVVPVADYVNNVAVSDDSQIILINGKEYTMSAAVYYSEKADSLMVPVRYICLAVGLPESAIKWDAANSAITIDAGRRQIWMQYEKSHYYLNRALVPILNVNGGVGIVEIKDNRAYVPYNTIGEALNITYELTEDGTGVRYNFATTM